jgi:hypothetical protein
VFAASLFAVRVPQTILLTFTNNIANGMFAASPFAVRAPQTSLLTLTNNIANGVFAASAVCYTSCTDQLACLREAVLFTNKLVYLYLTLVLRWDLLNSGMLRFLLSFCSVQYFTVNNYFICSRHK